MKKSVFAAVVAVAVGFITAVVLCVQTLYAPQPVFSQAQAGMTVVVDAGHGGIDGGVTGKKTGKKESDLNLAIAFCLKTALEDKGFSVVLTRKTEAGLYDTTAKGFKKRDMQRRREIIEEIKPDFVLSLHQNFYPSRSSRGAQVFYKKGSANGERFATLAQEKLNGLYAGQGVKARKATAGEFFMLDCSTAPSLLIECGFLSNPADEALLVSSAWQRKLAETVASSVLAYLSNDMA